MGAGNKENLKKRVPFKKGEDKRRNVNGRPKRLVNTINDELAQEGYERVSQSQMVACFETVLNLPYAKLLEIAKKDSDYPILYKIVCKELLNNNRGAGQLEKLLDRVYGKPKQSIDHTTQGEAIVNKQDLSKLTDDELKQLIAIQSKLAGS